MKNGNGFALHVTLGQMILSVIGILVTVGLGVASYEFADARASAAQVLFDVHSLKTSVDNHHVDDATRDSSARTDINAVKGRMDRMETMLERISYRVGAMPPPRTDNSP